MLQNWINQNMLLYGMAAAGLLGVFCTMMVNRFYGRAIRDLKRMDDPKTKWMGQVVKTYKESNGLTDAEVFVRNQMNEGTVWGIQISRWRRGSGYLCMVCFICTCLAFYGCYQYQLSLEMCYRHGILGIGIFSGLLLLGQLMGFAGKEQQIQDGILDYMANQNQPPKPEKEEVRENKEESVLVDQVMQGIRQTAAAGTKFSGLLSKEEERVMREIIRAYLV